MGPGDRARYPQVGFGHEPHPRPEQSLGSKGHAPPITVDMDELDDLLFQSGGVITTQRRPRLSRRLSRWCAAGRLIRVLKGVYISVRARHDPGTLIRAVASTHPDAIFTGRTAAWLNGWSDLVPTQVTAIHPGRSRSTGLIRLVHGSLSPETWHEVAVSPGLSLRVMTRAMTAVDLITDSGVGATAVDSFMRAARDTDRALEALHGALAATPGRPGNLKRRHVLDRTNTNPWSGGERELHDVLDRAGITGWRANLRLHLNDSWGNHVIPDVLFPKERLILEFDSWTHHSDRDAFERDRHRNNRLVVAGWRILHVTHRMLQNPRQLLEIIEAALATSSTDRPTRARGSGHHRPSNSRWTLRQ